MVAKTTHSSRGFWSQKQIAHEGHVNIGRKKIYRWLNNTIPIKYIFVFDKNSTIYIFLYVIYYAYKKYI